MWRVTGVLLIVIFIADAASASEIRPKEYSYSYELAESRTESAFLVCDSCQPRKSLDPLPKGMPTVISIRMSEPNPLKAGSRSANVIENTHGENQDRALTDTSLIVYFDFGSFALRSEEEEKLKEAPSLFKGDVIITGYTCDIGSDEHNRRLSLKRAGAVADYLRRIGVAPLEITGKGRCCPASDKRELNRRVEIEEAR